MLAVTVRTVVAAIGFITAVLGVLTMVTVDAFGGAWIAATGGFLLVVAFIERRRYRSSDAELAGEVAGPGGGEPVDQRIDPRFQPTPEVFVDPTTGHKMRVLVDPRTGERRYRAEG